MQKGHTNNPRGRPKGAKTSPNAPSMRRKRLLGAQIEGADPLDFNLNVMKSKDMPLSYRMQASANALPYTHRKKPIEVEIPKPITIISAKELATMSDAQLEKLHAALAAIAVTGEDE